jgi:hypothetical protein
VPIKRVLGLFADVGQEPRKPGIVDLQLDFIVDGVDHLVVETILESGAYGLFGIHRDGLQVFSSANGSRNVGAPI